MGNDAYKKYRESYYANNPPVREAPAAQSSQTGSYQYLGDNAQGIAMYGNTSAPSTSQYYSQRNYNRFASGFNNYLRNYNSFVEQQKRFGTNYKTNNTRQNLAESKGIAEGSALVGSQGQDLLRTMRTNKDSMISGGYMTEQEYDELYEQIRASAEEVDQNGPVFYNSILQGFGVRPDSSKGVENFEAAQAGVDASFAEAGQGVTVIPGSNGDGRVTANTKDYSAYVRSLIDSGTAPQEAAKIALELTKKEPEVTESTTTSGSYDVAHEYSDRAAEIMKAPTTSSYKEDLLKQMDEAAAAEDWDTWSALNAQYNMPDMQEHERLSDEANTNIAQANFAAAYASAFKWDDYIAEAAQNPDIVYEGMIASQNDLGAYLDSIDPGLISSMEGNKVLHEYPDNEGWTNEQRRTFYYLYQTDRQKSAEYATQINNALDAEKKQEELASVQENKDNIGGWAEARVLSTGGMGSFTMNAIEYLATGTVSSKPYLTTTEIAEAIDTQISENLNAIAQLPEELPVVGGKGLGDAYQMGNSILQSTVGGIVNGAGWIGTVASGAMFFGSAADSAFNQAMNQGATPGEAIMYGIASGTFECLFEELSLDKIQGLAKLTVNTPGKNAAETVLRYLRSIGVSGFIEGSEEINTSIANFLAEGIILQGNSQTNQRIQDLMANDGLSYEDAWMQAFKENCESVAYDGIVGAISGGVHVGAFSAVQGAYNATPYDNKSTLQTSVQGLNINDPKTLARNPLSASTPQELIELAKQYGDVDLAQQIEEKVNARSANGKSATITKGQAQRLAASITPDTYFKGAEADSRVKKAARSVDEKTASMANVKAKVADIAVKMDGKDYTIQDIGYGNKREVRLTDAEGKTEVKGIEEVFDSLPEETQALITWADKVLGEEDAARAVYLYDGSTTVGEYITAMNLAAAASSSGRNLDPAGDPLISKLNSKQLAVAQTIGEEMFKAEQADVQKRIDLYERAKAAADEAINTGDVKAAREEIANLQTALSYAEEDHADALKALEGTEAGTAEYDAAKQKVMELAQNVKEYQDYIKGKQAALDTVIKQTRFTQRKKGTVSFAGGILDGQKQAAITGPLTKRQQDVVDMVSALADVFNFDYVFFDGDPASYQGAFVRGSHEKIFININAGKIASKNLAANALSHELTHTMEVYAPDEYTKLSDYILNSYIEKYGDKTLQKLINDEMASGARRDEAIHEVVANSCAEMLLNSQAVQDLAAENSSLFESVKKRIGDIMKKIRSAFGDIDTRNATVLARNFEDLQKYWDNAARAMVENRTNLQIAERFTDSFAVDEENNIIQFSRSVTSSDTTVLPNGEIVNTLDWLNEQEKSGNVIHVYKSYVQYEKGGPLYAPMATMTKDDNGKYKLSHGLMLNEWEVSEGNLKNVNTDKLKTDKDSGKQYAEFPLKKTPEEGGGSVPAAYNPYQHSSNYVLNDQFEAAYRRPNLVTVECIIPVSELNSGYWAPYAKDPVGVHEWHKGTVASNLKNADRQVYMSRWLKPIRVLDDSEVAQKYAELLEGEDVKVPFSVVSPGLLLELEKIGVPIDYEGSPQYRKYRSRNIPENISNTFEDIAKQRLIDAGNVSKKTGLPTKDALKKETNRVRDKWMLTNWGLAYIPSGEPGVPGHLNSDNGNDVPSPGSGIHESYQFQRAVTESISDEQEMNRIEQEIENINNRLMFETDPTKEMVLNNRLYKLDADRRRLIAKERSLTKKTPIDTILANLDKYRYADLVSMASQFGEGEWDIEPGTTREQLVEDLREALTERAADMSPLERQAPSMGLYVRPVEDQNQISIAVADTNTFNNGFYSKAEQVVTDQMPAKLGANQLIGYLSGKGVKAEEIKWSGLAQWLEGKKNVTKEEVLEFLQANRVQIDIQTLNDSEGFMSDTTGNVYSTQDEWEKDLHDRYGDELEIFEDEFNGDTAVAYDYDGNLIDSITNGEGKGSTNWKRYILPGGRNYQEILFKFPGSNYTNPASTTHWKKNSYGVFAHARLDEFNDTDGNRVLFIEELQSDWSNKGRKTGFVSGIEKEYVELAREKSLGSITEEGQTRLDELSHELFRNILDSINDMQQTVASHGPEITAIADSVMSKIEGNPEAQNITKDSLSEWIRGRQSSPLANEDEFMFVYSDSELTAARELATRAMTSDENLKFRIIRSDYRTLDEYERDYNNQRDKMLSDATPDAPYSGESGSYYQYVLKNILRIASESDYDSIGWTPSEDQIERWSDEYAEGYRIEYDQDIPKFLRKYGKQWGAKVGTTMIETSDGPHEVWSMDITDAMRESILTEGQTQFQRAADKFEEDHPNLVAVHNKSVSGLRRMLQRNGVPFPSIAIKAAGTPHEGFGDVSIVFPRSSIDPAASRWNRLYSNDAWTPTEPRIEYDVDIPYKFKNKLRDELGEELSNAFNLYSSLENSEVAKALADSSGNIFEALNRNPALRYLYLKSIGQSPKASFKEAPLDRSHSFRNEELLYLFERVSADEILNASYDSKETLQKIADVLNDRYHKKYSAFKSLANKIVYEAEDINLNYLKDALRAYQRNGNKAGTEVDNRALARTLEDNKVLVNDPGYRKWIEDNFGNIIKDSGIRNNKDVFTSTGNRRSFKSLHTPATLDNIVELMRKQNETGVGAFGITLKGAATKAYSNVEEMRADSSRLLGETVHDDVFDSYTKEFNERLTAIIDSVADTEKYDTYSAMNIYNSVRESLLEAIRDSSSKAQMKRMLTKDEQWHKGISNATDDLWALKMDVQNMPAPYFEAKLRRVVTPDEALAYIVPDNTDPDVLRMLDESGFDVLTYKAGDSEDRLKKLNSVEGAQFQRWANTEEQTSEELADTNIAVNALQVENATLKGLVKDLNNQIKDLVKDAEKQGKKLEDLKRQMKKTDQPEVREADAIKMARSLIRTYHSHANVDEIAADIKAIGDYLVQRRGDELSYSELYSMSENIANKLISEAYGQMEDIGGERAIHKEIAAMIKGRKFFLPDTMRGELDVLDGYNSFRKKNFGRFTLGEGGEAIDTAYEELQDTWGKVYFPDVNSQGEMIMVMAEIFDQAKDEYGNPFAADHDEILSELANTILSDAISEDLRQMTPTLADKQQAKLKALQAKYAGRISEIRQQKNERIADVRKKGIAMRDQAVARERAKKYEKIAALREHYAKKEKRAAERRSNTKVRDKIRKLIRTFNTRLKHPSEKNHVPVELMQQTVDLLQLINLDTGRSENISAELGKLRNLYDSYKQNPTYAVAYDDFTSESLKALALKIGETPLSKMTSEQLDAVYQTLKSLDHVVRDAVKVRIRGEERNAYELSKAMTEETRSVNKAQSNTFTHWLNSQLRADVMFRRLAGFTKNSTWEMMADLLNDGQLTMTEIQMMLSSGFADLVNDEKAMQHFTGTTFAGKVNRKDLVDIGLRDENGNAILISHDMMVGIYLDLLNEQNRRHFIYGGKTIPDLQKFYSGNGGFDIGSRRALGIGPELSDLRRQLAEAKKAEDSAAVEDLTNRIKLTEARGSNYAESVLTTIQGKMTLFDHKWAKATIKMMNEDSKRYLNETTMEVYGIEKAQVDNYFPIITDKNFLTTPFETITRDMNLENAGFMKERISASNPTYAMGTFTVVNRQINKVAQYCGLMPAIRSFNKVYNKTGAGYSDSLKQALSEKFGQEGTGYIENLISDLTGSRKEAPGFFQQALGKLRGNLAQTTLTLNPRVALGQTASFPTAAAELGWGPLMKALAHGGRNHTFISRADQELIAKYSPLLWLRMQGYSQQELADIKNSNNLQSKVWKKMRWATGWIQAADGATVGRLWNAAEYWVQDHNKSLKVGTDEYYQAVAKKFNAVVEKTQPNYTTMQRAAILRDPNALVKTLTMFMTQRLQNFNILYNATASYQRMRADYAGKKGGVTLRDVQMAKNDMVRAVSSQLAQTATYVAFKFIADALLHGLDKYRDDDDDELSAKSIGLQLLNDYVDALIGMFLFGTELYTAIKAIAGFDNWYGLSVNGVDTINDLVTDIIAFTNAQKNYDPEDEKSREKLNKAIFNFVGSVAQTMGIPLNNAKKIADAMHSWITDAINGQFYSEFELDSDALGIRLVKALEDGDTEQFDAYSESYTSTKSMYSAIEKKVREGYLAKKQKYTKEEAIDLLIEAGEPKRTAQDTVQKWTCELATGIPYEEIDDQFMADKISQDRAAELYVTYGGMTKEEAASTVLQIKCEKVTGIKYSNIKSEYIAGNLTNDQVKSMLKTYGGKDEGSASKTVLKYEFEKVTEYSWDDRAEALYAGAVSDKKLSGYLQKISPTTYGTQEKADNQVRYLHFIHDYPRYSDLSESQVKGIYTAKDAAGITMQQAIDYQIKISECKGTDKDGDGKTDTNSLRDAKIRYIASLPYSYETKLALFKLNYTSESALKAFNAAVKK